MNLHHFTSYFEMFTVLNFTYALSKVFREGLNYDVLSLGGTVSKGVTEAKNKILVTTSEGWDIMGVQVKEMVAETTERHDKACSHLGDKEIEHRSFCDGFTSMFLLSGFFCLYVLLLEGYEQFYDSKDVTIIPTCLMIMNGIKWMSVIIFVRSFTPWFNTPMKPVFITIIFIAFVCFSIFISAQRPYYRCDANDYRAIISWAALIAAIPILFHFIRVMIHKSIFRLRFFILNQKMHLEYQEIQNGLVFSLLPTFKVFTKTTKSYHIRSICMPALIQIDSVLEKIDF